MKTTINIADDLITRAREVQKRDDVTLRALVEEGLRVVLDRHVRRAQYKFVPVVVGEPWEPGMPTPDVNALVADFNQCAWVQRDFGGDVQEDRARYRKASRRVPPRKRT